MTRGQDAPATAPDSDGMRISHDAFLGGRVTLMQPAQGYRAATDPVFLAAAVPARPGEQVLELGVGTGAAALCLACRVPGVRLSGLEIDETHLALARANADRNGVALELFQGSVAAPPSELRRRTFDHVMMNPPFFGAEATASPHASRAIANRSVDLPVGVWVDAALARLKPKGWLTLIQRIERLPEVLGGLDGRAGDICVKPLAARVGRPAKRFVLRARKGARGPLRLLAPLVLHEGGEHHDDGDDFTEIARAILRDAEPMPFA